MKRKKVAVVTGGAGFIGSHMVDLLLAKDFEVRILDNLIGGREANFAQHANNSNLTFENRDIRTIKSKDLIFKDAQYVLHFAGIGDIVPSIEAPEEYMDVNVQGTIKVLEAARWNEASKFVYAASSSCYGIATTPTDEEHAIHPQYPYALSKYMGEQVSFHWNKVYGLPVNSLRIFNAFGTRSRTSGAYGAVFGVFLRQILANTPLTVVGDGNQRRDFLYVTDVAQAFFAAAETRLSGQIWNLGAGSPKSILHLVELLGGKATFIPKRPGEPDCTHANIRKIRRDLDWSPKISFEEGVAKTLENINYWKEAPLWDSASIENATKRWFQYLGQDQEDTSG